MDVLVELGFKVHGGLEAEGAVQPLPGLASIARLEK